MEIAAASRCFLSSCGAFAAPPKPGFPAFNASLSSSSRKSFTNRAVGNPFMRFRELCYHASPYSNSTSSEETLRRFSRHFDDETGETSVVEEPSLDKDTEDSELLDKLKSKVASEESYVVLFYGSGALLATWISSIVVGALDSIPLFPQLMEAVGIAFTIWFSYRYLLFKKNRDELAAKFDELKEKILGSSDH